MFALKTKWQRLIASAKKLYYYDAVILPIELPIGVEHTVESFHIEVISPDIHFVNSVFLRLSVGSVEKETVCLRHVLCKIIIYQGIHYSVTCVNKYLAEGIVFIHILNTLKHTAQAYSVRG